MLTKIELAKSKLALHSSFLISLTAKLKFKERDDLPTAATDGRKVYYNHAYVESLPLGQVIGLTVHEVGHNMFSHPARLGDRDKQRANIAMDIILNQHLQKFFEETKHTLKAELPPGGLYGPQFDKYIGWNWEKVYADEEFEKDYKAGKYGQFDEVMPALGKDGAPATPQEAEALAKEWAMAAQQAATMAKAKGNMPGMFEEFIHDMVTPKVDWRSQVWDAFTKTSKDEQSWQRLNRRHIYNELYLPGMYSERLGCVAFYTDTSGSMGSPEFKMGIGAVNEVMEDLKPDRIIFGQCDTKMQKVDMLTPDDLPLTAMKFKGRGGTELAPIFEHLRTLDEEPELVVVLSDGFFGAIPQGLKPACPVVWLITTSSVEAAEASFGRIIKVTV